MTTTADDTRRAVEALGLTRGVDRSGMTRVALDAYSEVFETSRKEQRHHEQALLEAIVAASPWLLVAELKSWKDTLTEVADGVESHGDKVGAAAVRVLVKHIEKRVAVLRGEQP